MKKLLSSVLALALLFGAYPAHAGYAQLKPPAGWSQGLNAAVPGQIGTFNFGAAANGATFKGTSVLTNASLSVAGQVVTVPVAMRVAANAATIAAEFGFGNPYLLVGAGLITIAPIAYKWFTDQGFEIVDGNWTQKVKVPGELYFVDSPSTRYMTKGAICGPWLAFVGRTYPGSGAILNASGDACVEMMDGSPQKISSTIRTETKLIDKKVPASKQDIVSKMAPLPLPDNFPTLLPPIELPTIQPVLNPDPAVSPLPAPAPLPASRPLWVPTGDPVKNPNPSPETKPDTWTQPGVRVTPSPTPSDPWRVDVTDDPKTKNDPSPNTAPVTTPPTTTPGTPAPTEFETCGLPGRSKCLIDETGTPPEVLEEVYKPKLDDYKTKQDELTDKVSGSGDKTFFSDWGSIFVTPPLAACTGYILPRDMGTIDPCPVVDGVRTIMSYIWALTALFLAVGMVKKVV